MKILTLIIILITSTNLFPAQLKVASGGDDLLSRATCLNDTANNYWETLSRAVDQAQAGDTVFIYGGTYSAAGTGERFIPSFNPSNSGSSNNYIMFYGTPQCTVQQSSSEGPLIGSSGSDYIIWKNIYIDESDYTYHSDTGPVVVYNCDNVILDSIFVYGQPVTSGDNHCGIRGETATNVTIRNCYISDIHGNSAPLSDYHQNNAGMMFYGCTGVEIYNNLVRDCGSGIYVKGSDNRDYDIYYNQVDSCSKHFKTSYTNSNDYIDIYQNLIIGGGQENDRGVQISENSQNVRFINNTIYNCDNGATTNSNTNHSGIVVQNNITYSAVEGVGAGDVSSIDWTLDYNNYYNVTRYTVNGTIYSTLSNWQTVLGGCPNAGNECSSLTGNPLFVNVGQDSFQLQASSPCSTGIDLLDLDDDSATDDNIPQGCYITGDETIGLGGVSADQGDTIQASQKKTDVVNVEEN